MRRQVTRISGWRAIALCIILLLTACSSGTTDPAKESTQQGKEFANKELRIAVFEGGRGKEYWNAVKKRFEEDYPGVTVSIVSSPKIMDIIKPQIVTGNPPDLIHVAELEATGTIQAMIRDRLLLDLTDIFEGNALDADIPLKDKIIDGLLDYAKPKGDGKIYSAPFYNSPMGLIYNQTLFEQKGWKVPQTWDEFLELGEVAKADGRSLFVYQGLHPGYNESVFWPAVASLGGLDLIRKIQQYDEGVFETDAVRTVMELYDTIAKRGYILPGTVAMTHIQAQTAFLQGKALFIPCGIWIENEMEGVPREEGFEFGFLAPPSFHAMDQRYVMSYLDSMYIPAKAKNIDLAKEFIRYQYNDDIVKLNAELTKGTIAIKNGAEIAKPYISPVFYESTHVFNTGVKPIIFQWKPAPLSSNSMHDDLWYSIGDIMNRTMTVDQWQTRLEATSSKFRELLASPSV